MTVPMWQHPWTSRAVFLAADDVDTDQIIPARFLKATGNEGMGQYLFADWRTGPDGAPRPEFPLNRPEARGRRVLVAGRNFGCGSSREHAPWALLGAGFAAIVARSFGDIFRSNALKNGLLPVAIDDGAWAGLVERLRLDPELELTVDLAATVVRSGNWEAGFPIDPFSRHCLIEGVDELGFILALEPSITEFESRYALSAGGR